MNTLHQGERLLLLANRSQLNKKEIAERLGIHPAHLSKIFQSEKISQKIKKSAAELFRVELSYFEEESALDPIAYIIHSKDEVDSGDLPFSDFIRLLDQKDRRHHEERLRLLMIIENLTNPK